MQCSPRAVATSPSCQARQWKAVGAMPTGKLISVPCTVVRVSLTDTSRRMRGLRRILSEKYILWSLSSHRGLHWYALFSWTEVNRCSKTCSEISFIYGCIGTKQSYCIQFACFLCFLWVFWFPATVWKQAHLGLILFEKFTIFNHFTLWVACVFWRFSNLNSTWTEASMLTKQFCHPETKSCCFTAHVVLLWVSSRTLFPQKLQLKVIFPRLSPEFSPARGNTKKISNLTSNAPSNKPLVTDL